MQNSINGHRMANAKTQWALMSKAEFQMCHP
jgi:hypothetical protein